MTNPSISANGLARRSFLASLAAGSAFAAQRFARGPQPEEAPPAPVAELRGPPRRSDNIPDLMVTNQYGERKRLYNDLIRDQIVLVSFFYINCNGSCPGTLGVMDALRFDLSPLLGDRLRLVSISLDPERDTPAALAKFALPVTETATPGLAPWTFVTGTVEDLEQARIAFGYRDPDPEIDKVRSNHAALITFGNDLLDRWGALPVGLRPRPLRKGIVRIVSPTTSLPA